MSAAPTHCSESGSAVSVRRSRAISNALLFGAFSQPLVQFLLSAKLLFFRQHPLSQVGIDPLVTVVAQVAAYVGVLAFMVVLVSA